MKLTSDGDLKLKIRDSDEKTYFKTKNEGFIFGVEDEDTHSGFYIQNYDLIIFEEVKLNREIKATMYSWSGYEVEGILKSNLGEEIEFEKVMKEIDEDGIQIV